MIKLKKNLPKSTRELKAILWNIHCGLSIERAGNTYLLTYAPYTYITGRLDTRNILLREWSIDEYLEAARKLLTIVEARNCKRKIDCLLTMATQ